MTRRGACAAAVALLAASGEAAQGLSANVTLAPVYGGLLLSGQVSTPRPDNLTGVWSPSGRARLMKCSPRCQVVESIPLPRTLLLSSDTEYRVVMAGKFTTGHKVALVLRFRNGQILNTTAAVRAAR